MAYIVCVLFVAAACPDLPVPANGVITYDSTTIPRPVGSTATYTCDTDYQVTGLLVRTCTVTGWSTGDDPVCTGEGGGVLLNGVKYMYVPRGINNSRSSVNFRAISLFDRLFSYLLGHSVLACKD